MLSDLARSILLIAEAASRAGEPPPELATHPLVSPSTAGMLSEARIAPGPPEPALSPNKAAASVPTPPLPAVPAQLPSPPCEAAPPCPSSPSVSRDSSSWKPDVALRDDDSCCDSSGGDDVVDLGRCFTAEDHQDNTSTSENPSFPQFLKRLAKLVGFHLIPFQESTGSLIDQYLDEKPSCDRVAMPLHPILDKLVKKVWQTPHTIPPVAKEIERKYVLLEDAAGYVSQPAHESTVVEAAMAREKTGGERGAAPQHPELRRLDSFGQRVYQSAAAALRVVDYQIYMARGQVELWKKVSALAQPLPRDQQRELQHVLLEGMDLARHQVRAAFDAGDTVARAAASAVAARRSAWLRASGFHEEVQTKLENLPYTGENLFGEQVEATLQRAKERQATLRFLRSLYCPSAPRGGGGKGKAPLHKPAFTSTVGFKGVRCPSGKDAPPQ
ncbi:LAP2A protein, partial [Casuarius casuarius]|nr:LAP2A protein [Casuarius casuarius]